MLIKNISETWKSFPRAKILSHMYSVIKIRVSNFRRPPDAANNKSKENESQWRVLYEPSR